MSGFFGLAGAAISPLAGMFQKQTHIDDSAVRHQMQAREIANRQKEQAASRSQRAQETELGTQNQAARQRVEALDRIINAFQQNLRVR
jgi:hypothetical protein